MNKQGANQYQDKYHNWLGLSKKSYNSFLWLTLLVIILGWSFYLFYKPSELISPVMDQYPSGICGVCRQSIPKGELTIENMIKDTFKEDSAKAFQLLKCENGRLKPNAINVNKDGSRDLGVFQISEKWQRTQGKFLLNPKVNIAIAHQLYVENGKQFNLWSCGKRLGI